MKKIIAIGEALIDMIPSDSGCDMGSVSSFAPMVGGAPANVCGTYTSLGGQAEMITQLGDDPFGHKILKEFEKYNIGTEHISLTNVANTSLAFVALKEDGNREFSFYRKPGADMLLDKGWIKEEWFEECYALHFCTVDLGDFPMKKAHDAAIKYALKNNALISFDPNLRFPLWDNLDDLKKVVWEYLPSAHILKIADEELDFICGCTDIKEALPSLFKGNVELVLYTEGSKGASAFTKNASASATCAKVKAIDTTGAGDAFIGSFLYQLARDEVHDLSSLSADRLQEYLEFSNRYCGISVQKHGALASYPSLEEMK
ncbi:MAG: carbohydrate kinase [Erysipelotrichaceae bacterium]|nr:carbohydrate kinase [Erysipelotrichaceae bacterium]